MNRRTRFLLATTAVVSLGAAACVPPQTSSQVWPACTAAVTTVDDAQPKPVYPCLPAPPQRMDVLIPMATTGSASSAEVERCYDLEGYPQGPVLNTDTKLRCRTVKVA